MDISSIYCQNQSHPHNPQITEFKNYTLLYRNQDKQAKPTFSFIDDFALFVYINSQRLYLHYDVCCHLREN